jgi:hypothetical protein
MASFEEQFYLENPTRWQALRRDARLLLWLSVRALAWVVLGTRIRRAYREAQRSGEPLVLEDVLPPQ